MKTKRSRLRVGLVVPHIFMHRDILPGVIFSPGTLALDLARGLESAGIDVTLYSPGPIDTVQKNITADLTHFERELAGRGDSYMDLLKKHPFTFITLARQVQAELIAKAYKHANRGQLDIVHIYTNEEDTALPFASLCAKPVVFTHHDPFNFLIKYKNIFPKYAHLNWISISDSQRLGMPENTRWIKTIHHGIDAAVLTPLQTPTSDYIAYFGRIIEPKGVHLAIAAVKQYNETADQPIKLKIAGKHYAGHAKDLYWKDRVEPELNDLIEYVGFISDVKEKQQFLGNARTLIMPSTFDEPFGMSMIEALACGTPIIGLDSGAIPEVVQPHINGILVQKQYNENTLNEHQTSNELARALTSIGTIARSDCRSDFEKRFTLEHMAQEHIAAYRSLI